MSVQHLTDRRLVVVRHAKSAWPVGVSDHERPLGPRGLRDAPVMGQRIRNLVGTVDVAVVSPARRTQQTWRLLAEHLGSVAEVRTDARIYQDWGQHLLAVVADLPAEARTALIMGHEPGVSELVLTLADRTPTELRTRVATKFPTCSVAMLRADLPWASLRPGTAALELFTTPKDQPGPAQH